MVTQNLPHQKNEEKYFFNFYTKITFLRGLGIELMGKKQIWAKKCFWGVIGPPPKKNSNIFSRNPNISHRKIYWRLIVFCYN